MEYQRNDLVHVKGDSPDKWWIIDDAANPFVLYISPENKKHQYWCLITTNRIDHHVRPTVKDPCDVRPGPVTL